MKKYRFLFAALAAIILVGCLAPAENACAMYAYDEEDMKKSIDSEIRDFYDYHVIKNVKNFNPGKKASYGDEFQYLYNGIMDCLGNNGKYGSQKEAYTWMKGIVYDLSFIYPEERDTMYEWLTDGKYDSFNLKEHTNIKHVIEMGYLLCRYFQIEDTAYVFKDATEGFEKDFYDGFLGWNKGASPYQRRYFNITDGDDAVRYIVIEKAKRIFNICTQATRPQSIF